MIKNLITSSVALMISFSVVAKDHDMSVGTSSSGDSVACFTMISENGLPCIILDPDDQKGVGIAVNNFAADLRNVSGKMPVVSSEVKGPKAIIVGTLDSKFIRQLAKEKKIDVSGLKGKTEQYLITFVDNPMPGVEEAVVIVGSDRRGTIYGVYEMSEQIGVSPWYWWADVPVEHKDNLILRKGDYTNGEPAVRYRGLFLNDEAPCLTGWVKNYFGTNYGGHEFYGKVFELILRLRGNYMWPAMWGWAFYADDPANSDLADEMGVIMGTSHHEPMARNHQEWARKRSQYGAWDYATNKDTIDKFSVRGYAG